MFGGIDWAANWLDCAVVGRDGQRIAHRRIAATDPAGLAEAYVDFLRTVNRTRWRFIPTGIEDQNLLVVEALGDRGQTVVHIDPTRVARARKAATVGPVKSDTADAYLIADLTRRGMSTPIIPSSPQMRSVRVLAHAQARAVEDRASTMKKLRACLATYYPAAIDAWPKVGLRHAQARAVLAAAPTPRAAAALDRQRFYELLVTAGRWRTVQDEADRLLVHFRRHPAPKRHPLEEAARAEEMLALLHRLNTAITQAETLARRLDEAFAPHRYAPVITSVPGISTVLGARIAAEVGDRVHERFGDPRALAAYAGVAPVTWASGAVSRISMRRAANTTLQTTLYTAAFSFQMHSPGARDDYLRRRERGVAHGTALRALGGRLVRILYHCLARGLLYDEQLAFPKPRAQAPA
ncbi:IS110 family transposase [Streptomyces sp. NPDC059003]|uniref:IS110 family transposase n=1 Tax=Streptomyces sp. NPDC059003 TaxID=3346691 RepID=UPI0036B71E97